MREKITQLASSQFIRMNAVFFVGSLAVSALNYLYYPILGRMLPTESFGELQVLVSLYMQATIFVAVLNLLAINIVVNEKSSAKANAIISELEKLSVYIGIIFVIVTALLAPMLQTALKFDSFIPFIVVALIFASGLPTTFTMAYLRGKKDFKSASVSGILGSGTKLLASVALVYVGFKTLGAISGILVAQVLTVIYNFQRARKLGYERTSKIRQRLDWTILRPYLPYAGFVFLISLLMTTQVSIDSLAVKYYLSPEEAGVYGGISTIARIIFFLTGSIAAVMLSTVTLEQTPKQNIAMLKKSLWLTLGLGGAALAVFCLFPTLVLHILMGARYDTYAHFLPLLSMAIMAISISNLLSQYHMALRHYFVSVPIVLGGIVTGVALVMHNDGVGQIVTSLAIGSFATLGALLVWTAYRARSLVLIRS